MSIPSLKAGTVIIGIVMFLVSCGDGTPSSSTDNTQNPKDSTQNPTDSTQNPKDSLNLLTNSSFEDCNNQRDFSGWKSMEYFTDSIGNKRPPLVQDAPSGGGKWCIELSSGGIPQKLSYAESIISVQAGTNIYKVSAWMKTKVGRGSISLRYFKNSILLHDKFIIDSTYKWKQISFMDTLIVTQIDSFRIHISERQTGRQHCWSWFDNVKVEKVN